ncbi:MAG: DUF493 domain-containing protein [Myxococcales bacterium]|nr:DUF493 domain-containing protein [Myxococcales bacterium]
MVRVVVRPPDRPTILTAVSATVGGEANVVDVTQRSSRNGAYAALHIRVHVTSAEQVLEIYDVLQQIDVVLAAI